MSVASFKLDMSPVICAKPRKSSRGGATLLSPLAPRSDTSAIEEHNKVAAAAVATLKADSQALQVAVAPSWHSSMLPVLLSPSPAPGPRSLLSLHIILSVLIVRTLPPGAPRGRPLSGPLRVASPVSSPDTELAVIVQ